MIRNRLDIQIVLIIGCVTAVVFLAIGIEVVRARLGEWSERKELVMEAGELFDLEVRAELRCRGAVIGHVRSISPPKNPADRTDLFRITAGIKEEYGHWSFSRNAIIKKSVIQSAISPSWIDLTVVLGNEGVRPQSLWHRKADAELDTIDLLEERNPNEVSDLFEEYKKIARTLQKELALFTTPRGDQGSVIDNFALAIDNISHLIKDPKRLADKPVGDRTHGENFRANLDDASLAIKENCDMRPWRRTLENIEQASVAFKETTSKLRDKAVDKRFDQAFVDFEDALALLKQRIRQTDGFIQELTRTTAAIRDLTTRFGDTGFGHLIVRRPEEPKPVTGKTPVRNGTGSAERAVRAH